MTDFDSSAADRPMPRPPWSPRAAKAGSRPLLLPSGMMHWKAPPPMKRFVANPAAAENEQRELDRIIDHQHCFRAGRGHKAILTQPYDHIVVDEWRSWTAARGVDLLVPPDPLASFWYPGATLFIVLATPGTEVQWLPEQDGRLAHLWKNRHAARSLPTLTKQIVRSTLQTKSAARERSSFPWN
jgi:hypothetical protein